MTLGLAGSFAAAFTQYAAFTFATTLTASVIGKMTSKGIDASSANFGAKFASRSSLAPRQIIYGKCRVGGTQVHIETTGTDNYLLHMVVAIAGHEIESLENVRLNDINTTTTTSTISGSTVYTVTNADFTNTENDNNFGSGRLVRYSFEDGSQTTTNGFMNAQLASMGTTDKFLDVAYVYIQMVFDAEKFGGGMPSMSFLVKGKNIYDPRTSANATTDLQRSNPALIIRDYLTDTQYGLKAKSSEINDTTNAGGFASAANTCDQNVTLADGSTTETRYTANGFTNFSANGNGIIESVLSSMAGKMSYVNGQFTIFAGASQTPSLTITDDELLSSISVSTNATSGDLYNSVKPVYVDASLNYISTDAEVYQDATFLGNDTPSGESTVNYVKRMETQLPFTVTDTMAQRLGRIALRSQRQTTSLSVLVSLKFMRCQPNDWVYLTNERLGYSQKIFEVLSTNMEVINDGDVPVIATRLELKEIDSSVFNFATNDYTTGQAEGSDVSTGDYSVTAPTNLALAQQSSIDGTTSKVDIKVSWTNNASDKVTLTEIAYKLSTDANYTSDFTVGKRIAVGLIPNVVVGKTYNVKVRHIDVNGVASAYTNVVSLAIAVAGTAPSTPTNLTSSTGKQSILISWTNPNNSDLRAVKIYRRTANTTPTNDTYLMDTIAGEPNAITTSIFGDQDGLTAGTTYYFWVRAINHSGQHSAFSSSVNGTFTAAVIGDGTITTLKLAAEAVTNAKIAVDAIQGDVIAAGAITEAKLGVDAVTNAKLADNSVNTAQIVADAITTAKIAIGAITSTELGVDAVTNEKIADNAVQTAQIAASAITTAKIANDAVTNALIATDAVNQDSIAANSVTATQIVAGTITASEIAANAITTDKINAGAITTAKINAGAITATEIASNAITAVKIAADAVTADKVAANAIVANSIVSNAITSDKIIANAITTAKINAGAVTADTIATNAITAVKITTDAITSDKIQANAITSAKITAGAIIAGKLAADSIVASNIQAGQITGVKIAADAVDADKINVSTLSAITSNVGTLTAGTIDATSMTISNLNAGSITTGSLSASRLTLNGTTLTADGSGLKISTAGVATTQMAEHAATVFDVSAGSFLALGQAVTNQVLVTGSVIPAPPSGQAQNLAVIGNTMCTGNNLSSPSNVIQLILQVRTATTEAGVASASYSVATNFQTRGEAGEAFQTATCDYTTTAGNFYQFRFLVTYNNLAVMTGATRGYGPSTLQVISAYR
jgi:hypothetical protein